jgi:hypothetical protein
VAGQGTPEERASGRFYEVGHEESDLRDCQRAGMCDALWARHTEGRQSQSRAGDSKVSAAVRAEANRCSRKPSRPVSQPHPLNGILVDTT